MKRNFGYSVVGWSLVIIGVVVNEIVLSEFAGIQGPSQSWFKRLLLVSFQLSLITLGVFIVRHRREAILKLALALVSTLVILVILELALATGWFDQLDAENPIWIPARFRDVSIDRNRPHWLQSEKNEYGFNDANRARGRPHPGVKRIAVLGDSFVWGDAVDDSVIWTRRLQEKLRSHVEPFEVMHWGKRGWSTIDQFEFLRDVGHTYDIDLVVVAFVVNDPIVEYFGTILFIESDGTVENMAFAVAGRLLPNATSLFIGAVNGLAARHLNKSYEHWLERVYSAENLGKYFRVLHALKAFCDEKKLPLVFVLTPQNHHPLVQEYFGRVTPLLDSLAIPYLNLYPTIRSELGHIANRKLWAHPGDSHPGSLVTEIIAREVSEMIVREKHWSAKSHAPDG